MTWVAAGIAVAAASTGAGMIQANQVRQKQKGLIGQAYQTAQGQLNIGERNTREDTGESLVARGLTGAGDVTTGAAVSPGTVPGEGGATTLGSQQGVNLKEQQVLEQDSLLNEKNAAMTGVNETANQSMINAGAAGIGAGLNLAAQKPVVPGQIATAPGAGASAAIAPPPAAAAGSLSGDQGPSPSANNYPGSYGGVDPVNPLGRGAWAPSTGSTGPAKGATTTGDFNVNG
jgi:hypothetical protein